MTIREPPPPRIPSLHNSPAFRQNGVSRAVFGRARDRPPFPVCHVLRGGCEQWDLFLEINEGVYDQGDETDAQCQGDETQHTNRSEPTLGGSFHDVINQFSRLF